MYTFRFNPLFHHWVVLGRPVGHGVFIEPAHLLHNGKPGVFVAATNPRQPFLLDPPNQVGTSATLHREQPPIGEYELLLYSGEIALAKWTAKEWDQWLGLLQQRLLHFHQNPELHHVMVSLHTGWLAGAGENYQRVGELVATSHPVAGGQTLMDEELLTKLREREKGYVLHDSHDGVIYVPSAPLYEKEVWYIPESEGMAESLSSRERQHAAEALALLSRALLMTWPDSHFVLEIHTVLGKGPEGKRWWARFYQEERGIPASLNVVPLPEPFVRELNYLLGPGRP